ncbi:MAG TPA: hypothetical protein DEQ80_03035 [Anaerolinea thermolimosa]|uniref:Photosynthesis system II assembly factor Ycf48/Hcf136-like domain-containing protein n=1 Tax=Anaerolinea thermolimosa TaxID=229919 RepID=A0A3D1JE61_9CHLR|nr:hypothetical protein [Anaerolinea thermolimosa]
MKRIPFIPSFCILLALLLAGCNLPETGRALPTETLTAIPVQTAIPPSPTALPVLSPAVTLTVNPADVSAKQQVEVNLTRIVMLDLQTGWATGVVDHEKGEEVLRTRDGGDTWEVVTPARALRGAEVRAVAFFKDAQHAWVAFTLPPYTNDQPVFIWRTTDGGDTWEGSALQMSNLMMEFFAVGQIGFLDELHGWLLAHLGAGMSHDYVALLTTSDGGASWRYVVDPEKNNLPMSCYKDSAWFLNKQTGFVAGTCGGVIYGLYFYSTSDGGETWNPVNLPAPAEMPDAFTSQAVICLGQNLQGSSSALKILVRCSSPDAGKDFRWLYVTNDGGLSWKPMLLPGSWGELAFQGETLGWYFAQPASDQTAGTKVYLTRDGGQTWRQISTVNWNGQATFVDEKHGWVVAMTPEGESALVHTRDGGVTWELLHPVAWR